jgi:vacuolar protein sorting-associated protein 13A/C
MVQILQKERDPLRFLTSTEENAESDLMRVKYTMAERMSPEFETRFNSRDQDISLRISTVVFTLAPEPVIAVYDFIVTTFSNDAERSTEKEDVKSNPPFKREELQSNSQKVLSLSASLEAIEREKMSFYPLPL